MTTEMIVAALVGSAVTQFIIWRMGGWRRLRGRVACRLLGRHGVTCWGRQACADALAHQVSMGMGPEWTGDVSARWTTDPRPPGMYVEGPRPDPNIDEALRRAAPESTEDGPS